MTNEQIEQRLAEISELLADVTKEVVSLVKDKNVMPQYRPKHVADADKLLVRADALRQPVAADIRSEHPQSNED
jgi:hypothetical protein